MVPDGVERSKSQRNDDILRAAERVFARDGFVATTMDAIAREASVSKGGLYRHFSSKDELFLAIATSTARALEDLLRSSVKAVNGYSDLRSCISLTIEFAQQSEGKVKLALDCSAIRDLVDPESVALPAFDDAIGSLVDFAVDLISRGQRDGSIRSDVHTQRLAVSLWGAIVGGLQMTQSVSSWSSRLSVRLETVGADMADVIASAARP